MYDKESVQFGRTPHWFVQVSSASMIFTWNGFPKRESSAHHVYHLSITTYTFDQTYGGIAVIQSCRCLKRISLYCFANERARQDRTH